MVYLIFLIEVIVIFFYLDIMDHDAKQKYIENPSANYSAYSYVDVVDNTILNLQDVPEEMKEAIWASSPIPKEILSYFPNMILMQESYNDRVEDNGLFKAHFFEHMEALQKAYIAGEITEEQFKEQFFLPIT